MAANGKNVEGVALLEQGNYQGAMERFQDVLNTDPRNADALYNLEILRTEIHSLREALELHLRRPDEAAELTASRELALYFESVLAADTGLAPKAVANWVRNEVARECRERGVGIQGAIAPARLAAILALVERGTISLVAAREVQGALWGGGDETAAAAAERLGLVQVKDEAQLAAWVDGVVADFPAQVAELRAGKAQLLAFLTGQVMKRSGGRAEPKLVQRLLREALEREPRAAG